MNQQINLYHPVFRKEQKRFSARAMVEAVGLVLLGVVLLYGYTAWQVRKLAAAVAQTRQEQAAAAKQLAAAEAQFGGRGYAERLADLRHTLRTRAHVVALLAGRGFGNVRGYSEYFTALARATVPGLWVTSFRVRGAGQEIELQGRTLAAALVPRYLAALTGSAPFAGTDFRRFQITRPGKAAGGPLEFTIARHLTEHLETANGPVAAGSAR